MHTKETIEGPELVLKYFKIYKPIFIWTIKVFLYWRQHLRDSQDPK